MDDDASEYERQRQENIARNKALLKQLQLDALGAGLKNAVLKDSSSKPSSKSKSSAAKKRSSSSTSPSTSTARRERRKEAAAAAAAAAASSLAAPRRTSSRLAGLSADSPAAKRKADDEGKALLEAEQTKRMRVPGDLSFEIKQGLLDGLGGHGRGGRDEERVFTHEDVENTGDQALRRVRQRMMGLTLWDRFEPNALKITPERVYSLEFHPTTDSKLVFAADKVGNLGILKATDGDRAADTRQDPEEEEEEEEKAEISNYKLHARTISSFFIPPAAAEQLISASYDSSIRCFDLNAGKSVELLVHPDESALSAVNPLDDAGRVLLYATLEGEAGRCDVRAGPRAAETWQCSDKKIGGCHVLPRGDRHLFATASLDRCVKIWDLRHMAAPLASHESRLSVSSAVWSATGKLATTSYDDTVKIYNPLALLGAGASAGPGTGTGTVLELEPEHVIPHNNQTGRWVTILKAVWQERPDDGVQKLVVANMKRGIDIYDEDGSQLAHLADPDRITAVPAVVRLHPTRSWVAGGTGSGKLVLYS